MSKIYALFFLTIFITLKIHAQQNLPALNGKVQDEHSNELLSGAIISIPMLNLKAASDDDGKFSFATVKPGTYWLVTKLIGYENDSVQITIREGTTLTHDIILSSKEYHLKSAGIVKLKK